VTLPRFWWRARKHRAAWAGPVLVDANLSQFFTDEEIPRLVAATKPQVDAVKKDPERPENRQLISTADGFAAVRPTSTS
jgi:hypothetical protein